MCHAQHLGRYLKGQDHSMTLQQNRFRSITRYLKSDLKLYQRNDHHFEMCHAQHLGRYLEGQGHSMTLLQNCFRHITSLFEVGLKKIFHRNDHHIETTCYTQHLGLLP